jgi:hypothetical protein
MKTQFKSIHNGATRLKKRFAFMPNILDDGTVVWMQFFYSLQTYGVKRDLETNSPIGYEWADTINAKTLEQLRAFMRNVGYGHEAVLTVESLISSLEDGVHTNVSERVS